MTKRSAGDRDSSRQVMVTLGAGDTAHDGPVHDLDVPHHAGTIEPSLRRRIGAAWRRMRAARTPLALTVVLLAVVALTASVATRIWGQQQQQRVDESTVSLAALLPGTNVALSGSSTPGRVTDLRGEVVVVNSGPLPVEVLEVRGGTGGLWLDSPPKHHVVPPGFLRVPVFAALTCGTGVPVESIPLWITVRTADSETRQVRSTLVLADSPWMTFLVQGCSDWP